MALNSETNLGFHLAAGVDKYLTDTDYIHYNGYDSNGETLTDFLDTIVTVAGELIISGNKTFSSPIIGNLQGAATTAKSLSGFTGTGVLGKAASEKRSGDTSNVTYYYPTIWTFDTGLTLANGLTITCEMPTAGHDYGVFISIDNGATYNPISVTNTDRLTTQFESGRMLTLTYDANALTNSLFAVEGSKSRATVTGGWRVVNYRDSDSGNYNHRELYLRPYAGTTTYRYKLGGLDKDNRFQPIVITNQTNTTTIVAKYTNTAEFCVSKGLYFYNSGTDAAANSLLANLALYKAIASSNIAYYNFNDTMVPHRLFYLKGTYDASKDTFKINGGTSVNNTSWYVQVPTNTANLTLSSYFTSGSYYWLVGSTLGGNNETALLIHNPLYYFDGTNLVPIVGRASYAVTAGTANSAFKATKDGDDNIISDTYLKRSEALVLSEVCVGDSPGSTDEVWFDNSSGLAITTTDQLFEEVYEIRDSDKLLLLRDGGIKSISLANFLISLDLNYYYSGENQARSEYVVFIKNNNRPGFDLSNALGWNDFRIKDDLGNLFRIEYIGAGTWRVNTPEGYLSDFTQDGDMIYLNSSGFSDLTFTQNERYYIYV